MRRFALFVATFFFASSVLGCPLLKKKQKGDDEFEEDPTLLDAATMSVQGTGAKNEASVLRYKDEQPVNEVAVIGKNGTKARSFPGDGPIVATLEKGTPVMQVARYFKTGVLIMFDDPQTKDGTKLMGWVTPAAFDTSAPKPAWNPPDGGKVAIVHDAGSLRASTDAGGASHDAGAAHASTDAGGAGGGGAIPQPRPGTVAVQPVDGKCPDNWMIEQSMCRRVCAADAECPRNTKCKPGHAGKKVCTSD